MIATARLATLIWLLIYGGLIAGGLGFALQRGGEAFGWGVVAGGAAAVVGGIVLLWIRSRRAEP